MSDEADRAQWLEEAERAAAIRGRRAGAAAPRMCVRCGDEISAAERARDPDAAMCGGCQ